MTMKQEEAVQDFLEKHVKMVLGINESDSYPNTSLMHYAVGSKLHIYFGTKKGFGKYNALKEDPRVSFVVIEEGHDPLRVVDGRGEAREIDPKVTPLAHDFFKSRNTTKWYVEGADDFAMFEIIPTSIRWLDATSGELKVTDIPLEY